MYTNEEKLKSLIEQAEHLLQATGDVEWRQELHRSITMFKKMVEQIDKESANEE
jgi:hypothetical protein